MLLIFGMFWLEVVGKFMISTRASCLENICSKCHLSSLTNRDGGYYYFACR
jgi:hypothetical protein